MSAASEESYQTGMFVANKHFGIVYWVSVKMTLVCGRSQNSIQRRQCVFNISFVKNMIRAEICWQVSSYLIAFANGHFEHIEGSYVSPLSGKTRPLRIYGLGIFSLTSFRHTDQLCAFRENSYCGQHSPSRICPWREAQGAAAIRENVWCWVPSAEIGYIDRMLRFNHAYVSILKTISCKASDFDAGAMENWVNLFAQWWYSPTYRGHQIIAGLDHWTNYGVPLRP